MEYRELEVWQNVWCSLHRKKRIISKACMVPLQNKTSTFFFQLRHVFNKVSQSKLYMLKGMRASVYEIRIYLRFFNLSWVLNCGWHNSTSVSYFFHRLTFKSNNFVQHKGKHEAIIIYENEYWNVYAWEGTTLESSGRVTWTDEFGQPTQ